jgi:DNA-binding transcriptional LysR family regulator
MLDGDMNQLEANDLLLFARVVEAGSLSRAAEALGVPTSTVSRRITALETRIGERLVQRTTRKLTVTEVGRAVLDHARHVVEGVDGAAALADYRTVKPRGRLRVSMLPDLSNTFFSSFIAEFSATYPSITLELDLSMRVVDLVGENYDVAIRAGPLRDDETLAACKIIDIHAALFASPAYLREHGTPREIGDLLEHFALHGTRAGELMPWRLVNGDKRWEGLGVTRVGASSPEMLARLAINGAGIAMCELRAVEPHVRLGQLVAVLPQWQLPPASLYAVFPERKLMPARTRVFIDALAHRFRSQPGEAAKPRSKRDETIAGD